MDTLWISILGVFLGALFGLNGFLLSDIRKKQGEYCNANRQDHQIIFSELKALPGTYRTITECVDKTKNCHENLEKNISIAQKAAENLSDERRGSMRKTIDGLTDCFERLSGCINRYTKGEC
jgi:hypothetical protein